MISEPLGAGVAALITIFPGHTFVRNVASEGEAPALFIENVVRIEPIPAMKSVFESL